MADQKLVGIRHGGSNPNNSTTDPRIIWEDGQWAIIEAADHIDGLPRSQTRASLREAILTNSWDANRTTCPGKQTIAQGALVKVKLADLLTFPIQWPPSSAPQTVPTPVTVPGGQVTIPMPNVPMAPIKAIPSPKGYIPIKATPNSAPHSPPSPFLPKPWGKDVPEFPEVCLVCGGRIYRGLNKVIHQDTEAVNGGACPGKTKAKAKVTK